MAWEKERDLEAGQGVGQSSLDAEKHLYGTARDDAEEDKGCDNGSATMSDSRDSLELSEKAAQDQGHQADQDPNTQTRSADPYEENVAERVLTREPSRAAATTKTRLSLTLTDSRRQRHDPPPPHPSAPLSDLAHGIVGWESQDDPEMPMNFSSKRKYAIVGFVAAITFLTPFASTILAPAINHLHEEFQAPGSDPDLIMASFPISIYLLGYAIGPLFLSGLSEIYGRHIVLCSANAFYCVWLIGTGLAPSLDALIVFRFLTGVGGSGCLTIGGGIIADMIPVHQRGTAITIWMTGPIIGPTIGPIIGSFVTQDVGWRWTAWIVLIASVPTVAAIALLSQETNPRVLIDRKTARLRRETGRPELRSAYNDLDDNSGQASPSSGQILLRGLVRPIRLLFQSPLLFSLSLYIAFCYGVLYLLFNTIPLVFRDSYGFSLGTAGLVYIPMGIGYIFSMFLFKVLSDRTVLRLTAANNGVYEPEMRLPFCIYFACLLPMTFFWYGWSAAYAPPRDGSGDGVHWIVPVLALLPFSIGLIGVWQPIQAYIIDAFAEYAASALAAFTVFRSVVAAFLPLAGPAMYSKLGLGWGNSLLGFVAVAMIPVPALIYRYGGTMRKRSKIKV